MVRTQSQTWLLAVFTVAIILLICAPLSISLPSTSPWQEKKPLAPPPVAPEHAVDGHGDDALRAHDALMTAFISGYLTQVTCGATSLGWVALDVAHWAIGYWQNGELQTCYVVNEDGMRDAIRNCNARWRKSLHPVGAPIPTEESN